MTLFGLFDNILLELNREDPASYKYLLRVGEILDRKRPNSTKNYYESFMDSCEQFTCCRDRFTIVTSYLRVIYGKINPWTLVRRFLTFQKICLSFRGSLRVSASCAELFTDTSELLTDACE